MIFRTAFVFELRRQLRSPGAWAACLAVLVAGVLAILVGVHQVSGWRAAISSADAAATESQTEARALLSAGRDGPEGRPWVDLHQPLWQDWYSGVRLVREPAPLALISAGRADHSVVAMRLSRLANPLMGDSLRLDNPELLPSGGMDLIFVSTCLVPLLLLVLGYGIGSAEREDGTWKLLQVQCGKLPSWMFGRVSAVLSIALGVGVLLIVVAVATSGAGSRAWQDALPLAGLQIMVLLPFAGLLAVAASLDLRRSGQVGVLGLTWILLAVLVPAVASDLLLAGESQRLDRQASVEARALQEAAYERPVDELRAEILRSRPELASLPYAGADEPDPMVDRHLFDVELQRRIRRLFDTETEASSASNARAFALGTLSPVACGQLLAEHLAGRSPAQAHAFRVGCAEAVALRTDLVLDAAWRRERLDLESFAKFAPATTLSVTSKADWPVVPALAALGWVLLGLAGAAAAGWRLRRSSARVPHRHLDEHRATAPGRS